MQNLELEYLNNLSVHEIEEYCNDYDVTIELGKQGDIIKVFSNVKEELNSMYGFFTKRFMEVK